MGIVPSYITFYLKLLLTRLSLAKYTPGLMRAFWKRSIAPSPASANQLVLPHPVASYAYAWGQCAAVSRILNNGGIPHIHWGDHVLAFHGVDQGTLMVAILLPDDQLAKAIDLLVKEGLTHCPCRGNFRHLSDPRYKTDLPVHLSAKFEFIHLFTPSILLNKVPLTPNDSNPLNLKFVEYFVPLVPGERVYPSLGRTRPEGTNSESVEWQAVERGEIERQGLGLKWFFVSVMLIGQAVMDDRDLVANLEEPMLSQYLTLKEAHRPPSFET